MAGDWIAWTKGLPRKLEVMQIATAMKVDRYRAACHCMAVWEWADENTVDGDVPGFTPDMLDDAVGIPGVGRALASVGWLAVLNSGIRFPKWDRYNTDSAKKRMQARERKRRERLKRY